MTRGNAYDYNYNSGYRVIYKVGFTRWKEMQKDIHHNSHLSLGGGILDDVFLFFYTSLSNFSINTVLFG